MIARRLLLTIITFFGVCVLTYSRPVLETNDIIKAIHEIDSVLNEDDDTGDNTLEEDNAKVNIIKNSSSTFNTNSTLSFFFTKPGNDKNVTDDVGANVVKPDESPENAKVKSKVSSDHKIGREQQLASEKSHASSDSRTSKFKERKIKNKKLATTEQRTDANEETTHSKSNIEAEEEENLESDNDDNDASVTLSENGNEEDNADDDESDSGNDEATGGQDNDKDDDDDDSDDEEETSKKDSVEDNNKVKMFFISPFAETDDDENKEAPTTRQILTYPATGHGWGHSHQWGPSHIWNSDYPYFAYGYSWGCGHHGYGHHGHLKKSNVGEKSFDLICRDYVLLPAITKPVAVVAPPEDSDENGVVRQVVSKDVACNDNDPLCVQRQVIGSMAGGSMFGDGMGGLGIGFPGIPGIHTGISGYNEAGGFGDHVGGGHGYGGHGGGFGGYGDSSHFIGAGDHGISSYWESRSKVPIAEDEKAHKRRLYGIGFGGGTGMGHTNTDAFNGVEGSFYSPLAPGVLGSTGLRGGLVGAGFGAPIEVAGETVRGPVRFDRFGVTGLGHDFDGQQGWGVYGGFRQGMGEAGWGHSFNAGLGGNSIGSGGYGVLEDNRGDGDGNTYGNGEFDEGDDHGEGFGHGYGYGYGQDIGHPVAVGLALDGSGNGLYHDGIGPQNILPTPVGSVDGAYRYGPEGLNGAIDIHGFRQNFMYKSKINKKKGNKVNKAFKNKKNVRAQTRQDIAMPDEQAIIDVTKQRQLIGSLGASTLFADNVGGMGLGHPGVPQMSSGVSGIPGEYGGSGGYSHGWEGEGPGMHPHGYTDYGYGGGSEGSSHYRSETNQPQPELSQQESGSKRALIYSKGTVEDNQLLSSLGPQPVGVASDSLDDNESILPYAGDSGHGNGYVFGGGRHRTSLTTVHHQSLLHEQNPSDEDYHSHLLPIDYANRYPDAAHYLGHNYYHSMPYTPRHVHVGVGTPQVKVEVETSKSRIESNPAVQVSTQKMNEIKRIVHDVSDSLAKTNEKLEALKRENMPSNDGKRQITPAFTPVVSEPVGVPDIRYPVPSADRYPLGAGYIWPSANYGHQYGGPYAWSKSHVDKSKKRKKSSKKHNKKGKKQKRSAEKYTKDGNKDSVETKSGKIGTKRQFLAHPNMYDGRGGEEGYPYHGGLPIYGTGFGFPISHGGFGGHPGGYGGAVLGGYGHHLGGHSLGGGYAGFHGYRVGLHGGYGGHLRPVHIVPDHHYSGFGGHEVGYGGGFHGYGGLGGGLYGHVGGHEIGGYDDGMHNVFGVGRAAFAGGHGGEGGIGIVGGIGGIGGYGHGFGHGMVEEHGAEAMDHGGFNNFGGFDGFQGGSHGGFMVGGHNGFGAEHGAFVSNHGFGEVGVMEGGMGGAPIGPEGGMGGAGLMTGSMVGGFSPLGHGGEGMDGESLPGFGRQNIDQPEQSASELGPFMPQMGGRSNLPEPMSSQMIPESQQAMFLPALTPYGADLRAMEYPGSKKSNVPKLHTENSIKSEKKKE